MNAKLRSQGLEPVAGLILAGGRARRMGGQDKGLLPLAGRPMVEHVFERLRPQVEEVVISANRNADRYAHFGHPVLPDVLGDYSGPLAGMLSGLAGVRLPWLAVVPCDSPLLPHDLVERLLDSALAESAELAVAHDGTRLQPVFVLLHRSLLAPLRTYLEAGGHKVDAWYAQHRMATTDLSDHPEAFSNINTPEDHAAVEREILRGRLA